jgi:carboxypeptidase Q
MHRPGGPTPHPPDPERPSVPGRPLPRLLPGRVRIASLCALLLLAARAAQVPAGGAGDGVVRLVGLLLGDTSVASDLQYLCDHVGGRPTGSPACDRSIDWFLANFRQVGLDRVWTESFPVPLRWEEGRSQAQVVLPDPIPLRLAAMPFSPGTPKKGIEAPVVHVGEGGPEDFKRRGETLRGAIALADSKVLVTWDDLFNDYMLLPGILDRARAAGAAALLFTGGRDRGLLYRLTATPGDVLAPFPMAVLAREDGLRLARLADEGARLRLNVAATSGPPFESRNVLADIRGRERPEEVVLAGAHLDSWDLGTGALDNGANCAMLLDIARQMTALGHRPRRTVRFALFTGEEQGMFGSLGYVRTHRAELDRHAAVVIFDSGTGRITGFSLGGREDLRPLVEAALAPVAGYGATGHKADAESGTDHMDFLLEGVPNLVADQAPANYMENYHAASDTFDKVDLRELKINAAIAAALIWGLAEAPERGARLDRPAIETILRTTGLDVQMKAFGLWDGWEKKTRGRSDR